MERTITQDEFQQSINTTLDQVCEEDIPLFIKRHNGENVVLITEKAYASMDETTYLLRSPKNAQELEKALNRNPSERISFDSIEELKNKIGI